MLAENQTELYEIIPFVELDPIKFDIHVRIFQQFALLISTYSDSNICPFKLSSR